MEDKPISVRLGARRLRNLERYLEANEGETRNGVIAGAVEVYLKQTGYWDDDPGPSIARGSDVRPTLTERVEALERAVDKLSAD